MKNILITIIVLIFAFSCKEKIEPQTKKSIPIVSVKSKKFKKRVYDTLVYPNRSQDYFYISKLSRTGLLFSGEFSNDDLKNKWLGVFKSKNDYYLSKTELSISRVFHPLEDAVDNKAGWNITTINKDTCIVLIKELPFLKNHKIETVTLPKNYLFPGDSFKFNFLNKDYILFATGEKEKVQDNPEWFAVWNYKLYLTTTKNNKQVTDLLVSTPKMSDFMVQIFFSGDIDNDGNLDLLINTSTHYAYYKPYLYLSKPAKKGKLLIPIGFYYQSHC